VIFIDPTQSPKSASTHRPIHRIASHHSAARLAGIVVVVGLG